jgi:hypothetical protein
MKDRKRCSAEQRSKVGDHRMFGDGGAVSVNDPWLGRDIEIRYHVFPKLHPP